MKLLKNVFFYLIDNCFYSQHEMIHAYLFIQGIREENGGHGPNFKRIMVKINHSAGTNITVYHTFYDEVDMYKTHWWRCNGLCQHRRPFFGYVRRTCNRAPGPNDRWWEQHVKTCSGTFEKIKEPEAKRKRSTKTEGKKIATPKATNVGGDIRKHFPGGGVRGGLSNRGGNTVVVRKPPQIQSSPNVPSDISPVKRLLPSSSSGNLSNVISFRDLSDTSPSNPRKSSTPSLFTGTGHSLTQSQTSSTRNVTPESVRNSLRNIWSTRFTSTTSSTSDSNNPPNAKRSKVIETQLDDDIIIYEPRHSIIEVNDSEDEDSITEVKEIKPIIKPEIIIKQTPAEWKKSILDDIRDTDNEEEDEIQLIDDDYDDSILAIAELADTSVIDDLFGEDTLLNNSSSDVVCTSTGYIACPLCQENMPRYELDSHLEGCQGVQVKIKKPSLAVLDKISKPPPKASRKPSKKKTPFDYSTSASRAAEMKRTLLGAGYKLDEIRGILENEFEPRDIRDIITPSTSGTTPRQRPTESSTTSTSVINITSPVPVEIQPSVSVMCPVCNQPQLGDINLHLDACLM